ncbi:alpha/beta-hydrolase [Apiospora arundinis]
MKRLPAALILSTSLGCQAVCGRDPGMVYGFDKIAPSANLTWTPCYDNFTCSRLEVPLDYSNRSIGTTSIALIKLAGKNATAESPSIVLIPGGPGGSGIDLALQFQALLPTVLGDQYNVVSFDPRGVNNSGLVLDCFSGNNEARAAFNRAQHTGITNASSTSLAEQYYASGIYGEWCNHAVENGSPHGYYVTTPASARDLLSFVEAEAVAAGRPASDAKLWAYGSSYGTVVGTTFASLFPDRVGRMVLDGVADAEGYYNNDWTSKIALLDEAMGKFVTFCHAGLQNHPVPVSGLASAKPMPALVTYADLEALFINAIYNPVALFPGMAGILHQLEGGNATALAGMFDALAATNDAGFAIRCADSYRRNKLQTLDDYRSLSEYAVSESKYLGYLYPIFWQSVMCRSFRPQLPDSMVFQNPEMGADKLTSFPILFTSNTIDPITSSAHKMSSRFPGSVVLLQEAVGHVVVLQGGSLCYFGHVQAYFQGIVPPANITCPQQYVPFKNTLA